MRSRSLALVLAALGLMVGRWGFAANATITAADAASKSVDAYVHTQMAWRHIPGLALAVIQHRQVRKISSYGYASVELSVPVQSTTVFNLASITKVFTAVAVMTLVDSGKLNLDEPIGKYLERLPREWQSIKVRQLLSHTSGLPDLVVHPDSEVTVADTAQGVLDVLRKRPLDFKPGTAWKYNQTNYLLLSLIIEKLSGQPFAQFCKSHLFDPLGLQSPVFGDQRRVVPLRATDYTVLDLSNEANPLMDHMEVLDYRAAPVLDPAGGLNISVADFSRWLVALLSGKLITEGSLQALRTPARLDDGKMVDGLDLPAPWRSYGLGMMLNPDGDHPQAGHMGGARTSMAIFPKDDLAVIVLTNLQGDDPDSLLTGIASHYLRAR
jgi:CubicO group peptidase (beta-lactamase class C family)